MYKPGSIRQITLTNFITHSYVEIYPGANLNMILGSNGSGKSSIVAGIILGLGGTPKTIGRGQKVSEYVKHNCNEATIALILQGDAVDDRLAITRKISITDISKWYLNGDKTIFANVKEYISKYNIQVDNLCQFLPQDRVADFAKMNKIELLRQTQLALCRADLVEKQDNLIIDRERHKYLETNIEKDGKTLAELKGMNQRLEGKVKNFNKRKGFLLELDGIARKNSWLMYLQKAEERQKVKDERDAAQRISHEKQQRAKPLEQAIASEKRKLHTLLATNQSLVHELNSHKNNIESKNERIERMKDSLRKIQNEVEGAMSEIDDKQLEIDAIETKLIQLNTDKQQVDVIVQKETRERQELQKESQALDQNYHAMKSKVSQLRTSKTTKLHEMRALENQIESQERLIANRLSHLEKLDRDAHKATLWLRENKHLFRSQVYEPLMIEINVMNHNHALYVENSISFRDKIAFLCTHKDDVALLSEHLCTRQGLRLNIVYQSPEQSKPQSKCSIEQLRRYGFNAYVDTLFDAPEPIMNYLCHQYQLHNIPVAFKNPPFNADQVPVNVFYRDDTKYNISVSKYSGNKAFKTSSISSDKSLSYCIDYTKVEMIKGQIAELRQECDNFDEQATQVDQQIGDLRRIKQNLDDKMQGLKNNRQQIINIEGKIKNLENKLRQMTSDGHATTREQIEEQARDKTIRVTSKIIELIEEINKDVIGYNKKEVEIQLDKRNLQACEERIHPLETEADDIRKQVKDAERTLQRVRDALNEVTRDAKYLLSKAKDVSNGCTPDDDGFDRYRAEYNQLPDDIDELATVHERINSRLQCLNNLADDCELEEYAQRVNRMEELEETLNQYQYELKHISANIERRMKEWLEPLSELVERINEGFSRAFENMGCAGEVKIFKGEDEGDYAKYGICVSVTYRNGAPLQELNNVTQSGGERAVATAAYMLSMQELTPVPFRCVDEINQGMDANNERRIFKLLVDVTSQPDTSQYFFITPKLVSNLKYVESIKIHFVHNSPCQIDHSRWNETTRRVSMAH